MRRGCSILSYIAFCIRIVIFTVNFICIIFTVLNRIINGLFFKFATLVVGKIAI